MDTHQTDNSGLRLAELIASLSLAIDLGLGQLMENFLRTCLLAVRLGKVLGVSEQDLVDIYYLGLIQHLGCTAYADETAAIFGDELEAYTWLITTDQGRPTEMLGCRQDVLDGVICAQPVDGLDNKEMRCHPSKP